MIVRRRLEGGEFSYVLKLGGEPLTGKKAVYTKFKELQPEVFQNIRETCSLTDESENAFDTRMLKLVPQLPFEEDESMDVEGENKKGRNSIEPSAELATYDRYHKWHHVASDVLICKLRSGCDML